MYKQWLIVIHIGVSLYRFIIYILDKSIMVGGCNGVTVSYLGHPQNYGYLYRRIHNNGFNRLIQIFFQYVSQSNYSFNFNMFNLVITK